MSRLSDYLRDSRWYLANAAVRVSNARYRATRPLRSAAGEARNRRNRRFLETGKGHRAERATRAVRSSVPVYRDRINPATGRPRRDDREIYRRRDEQFARMRAAGAFTVPRGQEAWEHGPDAYRAIPARAQQRSRGRSR